MLPARQGPDPVPQEIDQRGPVPPVIVYPGQGAGIRGIRPLRPHVLFPQFLSPVPPQHDGAQRIRIRHPEIVHAYRVHRHLRVEIQLRQGVPVPSREIGIQRLSHIRAPGKHIRADHQRPGNPASVFHAPRTSFPVLPAGTPGGSPIEVTFNYSTGGLLVTAVNISTGERFPVQILSPNTKSEEEIAADTKRISSIHTTGQV